MKGKIITPPHTFCPEGCKNLKPTIEDESLFINDEAYDRSLELHCEHEEACEQMAQVPKKIFLRCPSCSGSGITYQWREWEQQSVAIPCPDCNGLGRRWTEDRSHDRV